MYPHISRCLNLGQFFCCCCWKQFSTCLVYIQWYSWNWNVDVVIVFIFMSIFESFSFSFDFHHYDHWIIGSHTHKWYECDMSAYRHFIIHSTFQNLSSIWKFIVHDWLIDGSPHYMIFNMGLIVFQKKKSFILLLLQEHHHWWWWPLYIQFIESSLVEWSMVWFNSSGIIIFIKLDMYRPNHW